MENYYGQTKKHPRSKGFKSGVQHRIFSSSIGSLKWRLKLKYAQRPIQRKAHDTFLGLCCKTVKWLVLKLGPLKEGSKGQPSSKLLIKRFYSSMSSTHLKTWICRIRWAFFIDIPGPLCFSSKISRRSLISDSVFILSPYNLGISSYKKMGVGSLIPIGDKTKNVISFPENKRVFYDKSLF